MRSFRFFLISVVLYVCLHCVTAAPHHALARRQDDREPTSTVPVTSESTLSSSSARSRESSASQSISDRPSKTEDSASRSSATATSIAVPAPPSATDALTRGADPEHPPTDPLPLHPKITPAVGLAGVLMLTLGAVYAVIGIKNRWIHVFGSAAFLASLSVLVLIEYLANPPVSNGVQGAFFVACLLSGCLFGGLALVFSDLTEGLGCLLGGFCVSMWFLSLKEGGLITSTTGRAIFIACLSVAGFSLSFSHVTRTHGLIGSISFSGATVTMLGADCFSRAGWKEFWIYLWNLNPDIFPLNTTTYPVTKGVKVELAGVVILSVLGIISQLRLWRLIKERKDKREQQEKQKALAQRMHEAELGRHIEDKFQRERQEWEQTYGEKGAPGSSDESSSANSHSPSVNEKDNAVLVYDSTVDPEASDKKKSVVAVTSVEHDAIQQIGATGAPISEDNLITQPADASRPGSSTRSSSEGVPSTCVSRSISVTSSLKPSSRPPPPVIVPLPFKIPQEEDAMSHVSDNASVSALPDVEEEASDADEQRTSRRMSGKPAMKRMSTARASTDQFQTEDVAMLSQMEDDRRSSIAATLDEDDRMSLPELSRPSSTVDAGATDGKLRDNSTAGSEEDAPTSPSTPTIRVHPPGPLEDGFRSQGNIRQSLTVSTDPKYEVAPSEVNSPRSPRPRHDTLVKGDSEKSASGKSESPVSAVEDVSNALSTRLSKVAQSYRTNEWAKHLEAADRPAVDEIPEPSSPGVQLDQEQPAPVSEGIAQPFAVAKRASKRISSDSNVHRKNAFMQINSNSARQPSGELQGSAVARMSVSRQPATLDEIGRRVSSTPVQPSNVQSPSKTLMAQRATLMRNRVSTQNFNQPTSPVKEAVVTADEDMTLAQRRRVLKHQKPPSAAQKWKKSSWAVKPAVEDFDSHQPKRTVGSGSDQKREELLAGWRGSIQQTGLPSPNAADREEQQRAAMMSAKRQKEMEQQQQAAIAQHRESMRHNMMRSGEMLDAHREAMRRMQASASKRA